MLQLADIDAYYGRSHVLHAVTLSVPERQITTILGRNGVGKTTLLRTIMGLVDRSEGSVRLDGAEMMREPAYRRARAGIAYVPQGREIIPDFTVRENILMGAFARPPRERRLPERAAELFPFLMQNLERPGGLLSGGQQQQLAIARALAAQPQILLLDEPTEGIQPNLVEEIEASIIALNQEARLTIMLVEQNLAFARRAGQHFVIMEKGRVVAGGATAGLTDELVHRHLAV